MNVQNTSLHREALTSGSGVAVQQNRPRSDGVLTSEELQWCRANGIRLAFDPLQHGWVPSLCEDDLVLKTPARNELSFRAWEERDASLLARLLSSEALWQYLPEDYPGPIDQETATQVIKLGAEGYHHVRAITKDGVPIGQARLYFAQPGEAEISYWLGKAYWGKGFGSAVVNDFSAYCLKEFPDVQRLFAKVHKQNIASQRVLEKAAFKPAGNEGDWIIVERISRRGHA